MHNKPIVNSWNEWDELEEVVVGIADYANFEPREPGSHPKLRDSKLADVIPFPSGPKSKEMIAKANEELTGFVSLLVQRGGSHKHLCVLLSTKAVAVYSYRPCKTITM